MAQTSRFAHLISAFKGTTAAAPAAATETAPAAVVDPSAAAASSASGKKTGVEGDDDKKRDDETDEQYDARMKSKKDKAEKEKKEQDEENCRAARAEGVSAERKRWDDVLASADATGRIVTACTLLSETDLSAEAIRKTLAGLPAETPVRSTLAERTGGAATPAPSVGGAAAAATEDTPSAFAARVAAAVEKARGGKPKDKAA